MNFTDRPWVAYVGPFSFPEGGAATRRVFGNAKALVAAGYNVVVVSGYAQSPSQQPELLEPGIWSVQINERGSEHLPKVMRYLYYVFMGRQSRNWIDSCDSKPAAIILYSGYTPYLLQFTRWARHRSIKLIFDAVEWYTAQSALGFLRSPYYWNIEFAMRVLIPRLDGIISISSSLETYYKRHIDCVVSIPPLVDMSSMYPRLEFAPSENGISIAYSGSPGNKDLLDVIISAVLEVKSKGICIQLHIAGVTEHELLQMPSLASYKNIGLPSVIIAHGIVSHERSISIMRDADFTVFLREINRVSACGFPTKFVESLSVGTPVIANITSDLAKYLHHGLTGYICKKPTKDALCELLQQVVNTNAEKLGQMRIASRREAEQAFDFSAHVESIKNVVYS